MNKSGTETSSFGVRGRIMMKRKYITICQIIIISLQN